MRAAWNLMPTMKKLNSMLRYSLVILAVSIGVLACEKKTIDKLPDCLDQFGDFTPNNKPDDGEVEFIFYENAALDVQENDGRVYFEQVEGDQLVFKYEFIADDNPMIADDEYGEIVWFSVDPDQDTFEIHANNFKRNDALFGRMCFCVDGGFHRIDEGCIFGKKTSETTWEVAFAIQTNTGFETYTRMIQESFNLEQ